jgi:hypothetical protein
MKKIAMTNNAYKALALRATTILAAMLLVLLPATGFGSFAQVANANGFSADTSLSSFTIDGQNVTERTSILVDYGTESVDVVAIPTAAADGAVVEVSGDSELEPGANTVTVIVTAEDDVTTQTYTRTVNVAENDDASLGVFSVNGVDVVDGETVQLPYGTAEVDYVAEATDPEATVDVVGGDDLETGVNSLVVTVTAADGVSKTVTTVTLNVAENDDAS